jgi:hypothetical protein
MATKNKTMSFRVTDSFYNDVTTYCKHNNKTVSEVLQSGFTDGSQPSLFKLPEPSQELSETIASIGGGSLVGIVVYKGVYGALKQKYPTMKPMHMEMYSASAGIACALITGIGIAKLIKSLK